MNDPQVTPPEKLRYEVVWDLMIKNVKRLQRYRHLCC